MVLEIIILTHLMYSLFFFQIMPLPLIFMGNLVFGLGGTKKLK